MTEALTEIKHWGNSLGLRLPAKVARAAGLHAEQRVHMYVEGGRVVIEPVQDALPTLAERLARFDHERHGGEVMHTAHKPGRTVLNHPASPHPIQKATNAVFNEVRLVLNQIVQLA